jgi:predicted amino acid-binding ACT domain protein
MYIQKTLLILYFVLTCVTKSSQAQLVPAPDIAFQPSPAPQDLQPDIAPEPLSDAENSSDASKLQEAKIMSDSVFILSQIEQALNHGEAEISLLETSLMNDIITVTLIVTIAENSTSDEDTLSKICDAWNAALTNSSGRVFGNNCTWQNITSGKRAVGNIYLGSTYADASSMVPGWSPYPDLIPEQAPQPQSAIDDPNSSAQSKQQATKIQNDAQTILTTIENSLNPGEVAYISPLVTTLKNDVITVMILVTMGLNSTSNQDTLTKVCNSLRPALTKSSGRNFNDCNWQGPKKRAAGETFQGTTISPSPQADQQPQQETSGSHQLEVSILSLIIGIRFMLY